MGKDVIVACDFASGREALAFLDRFAGEERKPFVKIGMELFYAEGPQIVREIKGRGHQIFLDLKLHDIPNTVMKAMRVLSGLEVDLVNLHAAGTVAMMEAALAGLLQWRSGCRCRRYRFPRTSRRSSIPPASSRRRSRRTAPPSGTR